MAALLSGVLYVLGVFAAIPAIRAGANEAGPAARSAGCAKAAHGGSVTRSTRDGNNRERSYLVQLPPDYPAAQPYAVAFVFHASGGTAEQARGWGLQDATGAARGALFVFPTGIAFQNEGIGWDDRAKGYDLPFFDHMLADLEDAYCIDPTRVFATGFSWGGDFVTALACERGAVLRAVAVNSASDEFRDRADYRTYQNLPCPGARHPPLRFEHAADGDASYAPPYFATSSRLFQSLNGCSGASMPAPSSSAVMACAAFSACRSDFVECTFEHRLGHVLPPNWAEDTWRFFATQP